VSCCYLCLDLPQICSSPASASQVARVTDKHYQALLKC
jgi:hypothetical protein